MKKIHLEFLHQLDGYPADEVYLLAHQLGRRLLEYIGKDIFKLLLDSKVLMNEHKPNISDNSYKLHNAAKGFEGYLLKVIRGKQLSPGSNNSIGDIFGKNDQIVRNKIKDKKVVAKVKSVWDFCRNDVMHFSPKKTYGSEVFKKYDEIIETIILVFNGFYGKTTPDAEISEGFKKYISSRYKK